jgi:hypothetical protein
MCVCVYVYIYFHSINLEVTKVTFNNASSFYGLVK